MLQLRPWKVALVVTAFLFGLVFTLPNLFPPGTQPGWMPGKRVNLGLDLQGGSYLLLSVDTDALRTEQLNNTVEDVRRTLQGESIGFSGLGVQNGRVAVRIDDAGKVGPALDALNKLNTPDIATGQRAYGVGRGPDQTLVFTPSGQAEAQLASKAVDQSIEIIRRRIDQLGTREPTIIRQGTDRIVVEAPGESDPEKLKAVIGQTAKLTFQMVDDSVALPEAQAGHVPPGSEVLPSVESYERFVLVRKRAVVSGEMLTDARQGFSPEDGKPIVNFRFNGVGAQRFGQATAQNIGKRFAIVLDNKVISAPTINTAITGGSGFIQGNFTEDSASSLSLLLRSGALPAPLKFEEQRTVGAELGADAVRAGAISLAAGAALIFAFIILAYGLFGLFAAAALVVNILLLTALMSVTGATLTLPGIAGVILTLAVAVDANVLIYERMRDEARAGRTALSAADNGFRRALVSIVDANVTTLIAAAIMFQFGSGPVRGFAWTLAIGVLTSVFTAVLITQVLIGWWFRATRAKALPIS